MDISFNKKELESINEFRKLCAKLESLKEVGTKYDELTYEYVVSLNTGLGHSCKIRCKELGLIEDITDYGSW